MVERHESMFSIFSRQRLSGQLWQNLERPSRANEPWPIPQYRNNGTTAQGQLLAKPGHLPSVLDTETSTISPVPCTLHRRAELSLPKTK